MKHRAICSALISFVLLNASLAAADVWAINGLWNSTVHIYKNGKIAVGELPIPGIARDLAITGDGAYLYISYSDLGCGRDSCLGEGLVVFDLKTRQNVLQINDITNPGRLVIDDTNSALYILSGGDFPNSIGASIYKFDISKLASGERANQLAGTEWIWPSTTIAAHNGNVAFTPHITSPGANYWEYVYCGPALWIEGYLNGCSRAGLPNLFGPPEPFVVTPTDVIIASDQKSMLLSMDAKIPSLPTVDYPDNCDPDGANCWLHDVNVAVLNLEGSFNALRGFAFGATGVSRMASTGTRFYAITGDDGFVYSMDIDGTTYPPLQIGGHLKAIAYGYDGIVYVSESDSGMLYPIRLGKTPRHDRVGKGYVMPSGFSSLKAIVTAPPPK